MSTRYPPQFDEWPHDAQIQHIELEMTRAGLIAALLGHAGIRPTVDDISRDHVMTKKELAAVYLTLEGYR